MSYTALIPFKDGKPQDPVRFGNAWGGSARIWDALFKRWVPKKHEYDSWLINIHDRRLWDLAIDTRLPIAERSVHAFTFDLHYVRNEHFQRLANDLRAFVQTYPVGGADHLPSWATWLEENAGKYDAVGLHGTFVSENPWYRSKTCPCCHQSIDEMDPVPLSEGCEVYDWLEVK